MTKYHNADTSPERLAAIEEFFEFAKERLFTTLQKNEHDRLRDLLAMLQVRDIEIRRSHDSDELHRGRASDQAGRLNARIVQLELQRDALQQQLHDQRWRRLSSEMPSEFPIQLQERGSPPFSIYSQSAMPPTKTTVNWWWRPIPPLPTE